MQAAFSEEKFKHGVTLAAPCGLTSGGQEGKLRYITIGRQIFEVWEDKFSDKMRVLI